jgi:hypothetical protein
LRLVHTCCYYNMVVAEDEDDLMRHACAIYIRGKDVMNPDGMPWPSQTPPPPARELPRSAAFSSAHEQ